MDVFEETYEDELSPDDTIISGRWVETEKTPRSYQARWFLRGCEEKVEESEMFASTPKVTSARFFACSSIFTKIRRSDKLHS